jgi:hypothetical protein
VHMCQRHFYLHTPLILCLYVSATFLPTHTLMSLSGRLLAGRRLATVASPSLGSAQPPALAAKGKRKQPSSSSVASSFSAPSSSSSPSAYEDAAFPDMFTFRHPVPSSALSAKSQALCLRVFPVLVRACFPCLPMFAHVCPYLPMLSRVHSGKPLPLCRRRAVWLGAGFRRAARSDKIPVLLVAIVLTSDLQAYYTFLLKLVTFIDFSLLFFAFRLFALSISYVV